MSDYTLLSDLNKASSYIKLVAENHTKNVRGETPSHLYSSSYGGQETVVQAVSRQIRRTDLYRDEDFLEFTAGYVACRPNSPYSIY